MIDAREVSTEPILEARIHVRAVVHVVRVRAAPLLEAAVAHHQARLGWVAMVDVPAQALDHHPDQVTLKPHAIGLFGREIGAVQPRSQRLHSFRELRPRTPRRAWHRRRLDVDRHAGSAQYYEGGSGPEGESKEGDD